MAVAQYEPPSPLSYAEPIEFPIEERKSSNKSDTQSFVKSQSVTSNEVKPCGPGYQKFLISDAIPASTIKAMLQKKKKSIYKRKETSSDSEHFLHEAEVIIDRQKTRQE